MRNPSEVSSSLVPKFNQSPNWTEFFPRLPEKKHPALLAAPFFVSAPRVQSLLREKRNGPLSYCEGICARKKIEWEVKMVIC
jgi:hypothetical protein